MTLGVTALRRASAVAVVLAAALWSTACGTVSQTSFRIGTPADCAAVGTTSRLDDPAGDQTGAGHGPQGDLLGAALAASRQRLCLAVSVAEPVRPSSVYAVGLRAMAPRAPLVVVQVSVMAGQDPEVVIRSGDGPAIRHVDADVAIDGPRLTVEVDRAAIEAAGADDRALGGDARWQVRTIVAARGGKGRTDCVPRCA